MIIDPTKIGDRTGAWSKQNLHSPGDVLLVLEVGSVSCKCTSYRNGKWHYGQRNAMYYDLEGIIRIDPDIAFVGQDPRILTDLNDRWYLTHEVVAWGSYEPYNWPTVKRMFETLEALDVWT